MLTPAAAATLNTFEFSARAEAMLAFRELVAAAACDSSITVVLVTVDWGGRVWPEASTVRSTVLLTVGRVGVGLIVTVTGGTEDLEVELVLLEVAWEWRMPAIWVAIMPAASVELAELEVEELLVLLEEELDDKL